jgi:hypothetical protein
MTSPTPEMIEAGRMALVDGTGHGHSPELVRAVYDAVSGHDVLAGPPSPVIVPDELVKAAEMARKLLLDGVSGHIDDGWKYTAGSTANALKAALSLPHRTEADIRADERLRAVADAASDYLKATLAISQELEGDEPSEEFLSCMTASVSAQERLTAALTQWREASQPPQSTANHQEDE